MKPGRLPVLEIPLAAIPGKFDGYRVRGTVLSPTFTRQKSLAEILWQILGGLN